MSTFEVRFGKSDKWSFSREFDTKEQVSIILKELTMFYNNYANTHSLSSRTWKAPIVYVNKEPSFYISMNGSFVRLTTEQLNKIKSHNILNGSLANGLNEID